MDSKNPIEAKSREMLDALGKVVMNGRALEVVVHQVLAGFISADKPVANVVATGPLERQLSDLRSIAKVADLSEATRAALVSWLKDVQQAKDARNGVIHTAWAMGEDGAESDLTKGHIVSSANVASLQYVRATVSKLYAALTDGSEMTVLLASEDAWHGPAITRHGSAVDLRDGEIRN